MNFIFIIINRTITNTILCLINNFRKKINYLWHSLILIEIMIIKCYGNNNKNNFINNNNNLKYYHQLKIQLKLPNKYNKM